MKPTGSPLQIVRIGMLGVLALALSCAAAVAADPTQFFYPDRDTWLRADNNATGPTGDLILNGSGATNTKKEIFLRFLVDERAGTGTPMNVKLRLTQKGGFGSIGTIKIYAANNRKHGAAVDWVETVNWNNRPGFADELASATSRTTAGNIFFPLDDYVSGPGYYSFRIEVTGTAIDHTFYSNDTAVNDGQRPSLHFQVEGDMITNSSGTFPDPQSEYYLRDPITNIRPLGQIYAGRYELSNPSNGGTSDVKDIGIIDVTKQPYGAKGNDANYDSTWAIQRAVNDARDARLALYFPPGTYYVSRTIQLVQGSTPSPHILDTDGLRWSVREFPCVLLGNREATNGRSVIKITSSSTFFNTTVNNDPVPVLRFWSRHGSYINSPDPDPDVLRSPEVNYANAQYYQWLDNIDLDTSGKAAAAAIDMDAAQGTNLTNSKITATGSHSGIWGGTGPGGYTYGVEVIGGKNGAYFKAAHAPLIVNSRFTNQTEYSIYHVGRGTLNLVGVTVASNSTQPLARIELSSTSANPWMAALNAVDSRVEGTGLLINTNRAISLTNTFIKNGSTTASAIRQTDPVGGVQNNYSLGVTGWKQIMEYARGVNIVQQPVNPSADDTARVSYWINGSENTTNNAHVITGTLTTPPADLTFGTTNRHALPASPVFAAGDTTTVINAKTTTLGGGGSITADKLNAVLIAAESSGRAVFIPAGEFLLDKTVVFQTNTKLFGISPALSILRASIDAPGLVNKPMIQSKWSATAPNLLADLKLLLPQDCQPTTSMVLWRAGAASAVVNIGFDNRVVAGGSEISRTVPLVKITESSGGGKWALLWIFEGKNAAPVGGWFLEVTNTRQPLKFYYLDLEHCAASPQGKFTNAWNFDIFQMKDESQLSINTNPDMELVWIEGCQNFRAMGFNGQATPGAGKTLFRLKGTGNSNYMFTQFQYQQPILNGDWPHPDTYWRLIDEQQASPADKKIRGDRQAVLYKRGIPPNQ